MPQKYDAPFTDHLYVGLRNGKCVAIGWKCGDKDGPKENRRLVAEWVKGGLDIQTVHKNEADRYWDELRARIYATLL
jgi:hypothetical protein